MSRLYTFYSGDNDRKHKYIEIRHPKKDLLRRARHIQKVTKIAKKAGFELKNFQTSRTLELFFNIYQKEETFCYISRAWDDLGFRIGECVVLNKNHRFFKSIFYDIFQICSQNLISVGVMKDTPPNNMNLSLEVAIYEGGFNQKSLKETVSNLKESLDKIRLWLNPK